MSADKEESMKDSPSDLSKAGKREVLEKAETTVQKSEYRIAEKETKAVEKSKTSAPSDLSTCVRKLFSLSLFALAFGKLIASVQGPLIEWLSQAFQRYRGSTTLTDVSAVVFLLIGGLILWNWKAIKAWAKEFRSRLFLLFCLLVVIGTYLIRPTPIYWIGLVIVAFAFIHFEYYRFISGRLIEEKRTIDDPLIHPSQDLLGRADFARNLFKLIKDSSNNASRIAIEGEWGYGKTTCLNFVKYYAKQSSYPVAFFSPWQFRDTKEAWAGFVNALDTGIAEWRGMPVGPIQRGGWFAKFVAGSRSILRNAIGIESVGELFNDLLQARLTASLAVTKERVSKILQKELGEKPLIVFIDDLDRAQEEIVYEYFLLIKEIIDVRQCIFVCAFDRNAVRSILADKFKDVDLFLEKIFQYSYPLPEPTLIDRNRLLKAAFEPFKRHLKWEILLQWKSLWPTHNPRRIKLFLRHIAFLQAVFLRRFSDDDLKWDVVYIMELLKLEFPKAAGVINNEPTFPKWLSERNTIRGANENEDWKGNLDKSLIQGYGGEPRFYTIVNALAEACAWKDPELIRYHFRVLSHPEALTWKEYRTWYRWSRIFKSKRSAERVVRVLTDPKVPIERRREFLLALMRDRHSELSAEANVSIHEERIMHLTRALELTEDCLWLAELKPLFQGESPVFNEVVVKEWIDVLTHWAHFESPFYKDIRKKERRLILKIAAQSSDQASVMLNAIRFRELISESFEKSAQSTGTLERVIRIWKRCLAKQLLEKFKEKDGIRKLWGYDKNIPEKDLLFVPNSFFYSEANLAALDGIAQEAKEDRAIQQNFEELISILFYAAFSNSAHNPFSPDLALKVLSDGRFREMIWEAATCVRLHRRTMGSLLEGRKSYILITRQYEALPIPEWVKQEDPDLIEVFGVEPEDEV